MSVSLCGLFRPEITHRGFCLGRSEVLRRLRHHLTTQSQGHHTTDRLEEREIQKEEVLVDLPVDDKKGPSSVRLTTELFKSNCGKTSEIRGEAHAGFPERVATILK